MTTPERLRRRQRIEGAVLLVLGLFMVGQAVYFNIEDRNQRECFEKRFTELSAAVKIRAELAQRETAATKEVLDVYARAAGLVKDDPTKPLKPKDQAQLQRDLVEALLSYRKETRTIQRERRENPVPPYPIGTCERGNR